MELQHDVRDFLASRRARLTPDRVGLPTYGSHRRVAGLRREEVALLAGVSVDYDARLERGQPRRPRQDKPLTRPRDAVLSILHGLQAIPAYVRTSRMDIVAANQLCRALYGGALDEDRLPVNVARFLFLDPHSRGFYLDWDAVADDTVGALRMQAGRDVRDRSLSGLIGELLTRPTAPRTRRCAGDLVGHRRIGPSEREPPRCLVRTCQH